MSDLVIFTRTVGEPYFEECLRRVVASTPEPHRLLVWVNGAPRETVRIAERYTDDLIVTSRNKGCVATCGHVLLYEPYAELVQLSCAIMVEPGWIPALRRPFLDHPGTGITGMRSEFGAYRHAVGETEECGPGNLPDHLIMSRREVVERIGSMSPSFVQYGHEITEFSLRALRAGFRAFAVETGARRFEDRHDGRDGLADREEYLRHNLAVWQRCSLRGYRGYDWWRSDL